MKPWLPKLNHKCPYCKKAKLLDKKSDMRVRYKEELDVYEVTCECTKIFYITCKGRGKQKYEVFWDVHDMKLDRHQIRLHKIAHVIACRMRTLKQNSQLTKKYFFLSHQIMLRKKLLEGGVVKPWILLQRKNKKTSM